MEETLIQENTPAQAEGSGAFAKKYACSFIIKLAALFAAVYGGFNFYDLFTRLQKSGFGAKFWYVDLIYVFGYVFLCVGLFSNIGKNKPVEKLTSNLHTAQLGLAAICAANIFYPVSLYINYFANSNLYFGSVKLNLSTKLKIFFNEFGNTEQVISYFASALAALFAILLIKNVIGALRGDPAGKVSAILTALFSLTSGTALLIIIINLFKIVLPVSPLPFWETVSNTLFNASALFIVSKIVFMLFAAISAVMWLPKAAEINRYIINDEPEEEEEEEEKEEETEAAEENEVSAEE